MQNHPVVVFFELFLAFDEFEHPEMRVLGMVSFTLKMHIFGRKSHPDTA